MTHTPAEVHDWVDSLFEEARRDLVFLWNITNGSFGGRDTSPDEETLEAVVSSLVKSGCSIGFGDPDSGPWLVPTELNVTEAQLPHEVLQLWRANRAVNEFLVFAARDVLGRGRT